MHSVVFGLYRTISFNVAPLYCPPITKSCLAYLSTCFGSTVRQDHWLSSLLLLCPTLRCTHERWSSSTSVCWCHTSSHHRGSRIDTGFIVAVSGVLCHKLFNESVHEAATSSRCPGTVVASEPPSFHAFPLSRECISIYPRPHIASLLYFTGHCSCNALRITRNRRQCPPCQSTE